MLDPLFLVSAPFLLAAVTPAIGRRSPRAAALAPAVLAAVSTAVLLAWAPGILAGRAVRAEATWLPSLGLNLAFSVDGLALLFGILISAIGSLVFLYAAAYLAGHSQATRFTVVLLAFFGSMLGLVLADDLLLLFVFWGVTGLTSYLLIGFEHARPAARQAANQAFLVTMAGELVMLVGLLLLLDAAGEGRISRLGDLADPIRADPRYSVIVVLIAVGALTKSAQFPFHFWLPNAMEAPTPVSAYLHSATMVKAGVYLFARLSPVLGGTDLWLLLLTVTGGVTLLVGGWMSLGQTDVKRILAYSTVAALGLMIMLLGLGTPEAALAAAAVILAHASYKGALFLVAGAIEHATGTRDIRQLGGLGSAMPLTRLAAGIAALSMIGLPGLLGFVAKEVALKSALSSAHAWPVAVLLGAGAISFVAVAVATGIRPFTGRRRASTGGHHAEDGPPGLWLGPVVLAVIGLVAGLAPAWFAAPLATAAALDVVPQAPKIGLAPWYAPDLALGLSAASVGLGFAIAVGSERVRAVVRRLDLGGRLGSERAWEAGVQAMQAASVGLTRRIQSGRLRRYILVVVASLVGLLGTSVLTEANVLGLALQMGVEAAADARLWEAAVAAAIVVGALVAVRTNSRLSAIAALGVVGYAVALVYAVFGAPDLAMTQILVETLTIILFVLVFYHLPRFATFSGRADKARDAAIAVLAGGLVTTLVLTASLGAHEPISRFFSEASLPEGHGRNVVNVILVDFRALDTLGEVTVLAVAGIGVIALLRLRPRRRDPSAEGSEP